MRFKIKTKSRYQEAVEYTGQLLGLFDPDYAGDDERQSSGYHAYKQLVNYEGDLPKDGVPKRGPFQGPGYYLLQTLHPNIRETALKFANAIRNGTLVLPDEVTK